MERRDHVLITDLSFAAFRASTFLSRLASAKGPFFNERDILYPPYYFDKAFHKINNLEELDNYRRKLEHFRELIGITDGYTFFDDYYTEKMSQLEHKSNVLENGGIETALELKQPSKFGSWFRALKNFVTGEKIHN